MNLLDLLPPFTPGQKVTAAAPGFYTPGRSWTVTDITDEGHQWRLDRQPRPRQQTQDHHPLAQRPATTTRGRSVSLTPTKLTLRHLRAEGWPLVEVVERWNPQARIRQDLFGFIDVLAVGPRGVLAVQTTSAANVAARVRKIAEHDNVAAVREAGIADPRPRLAEEVRPVGPPTRSGHLVSAPSHDCRHPDEPDGYVARAEWFEEMSKTHDQSQCGECQLWTIWEPKETA